MHSWAHPWPRFASTPAKLQCSACTLHTAQGTLQVAHLQLTEPCLPACSPPPLPCMQLVLINVSDHFTRFKANGPEGAPPPTVMGCLLGVQDGRSVDVVNSFEMRFTQGEAGWEIDQPFLLKKQEQCEAGTAHRSDAGGWGVYVCSGCV